MRNTYEINFRYERGGDSGHQLAVVDADSLRDAWKEARALAETLAESMRAAVTVARVRIRRRAP